MKLAEISGLGKCGICLEDLQNPVTGTSGPIRHYKGHQLAHKHCHEHLEAFKQTAEYKLAQAKQRVGIAKNKILAAEAELTAAEAELARLEDPSN